MRDRDELKYEVARNKLNRKKELQLIQRKIVNRTNVVTLQSSESKSVQYYNMTPLTVAEIDLAT
jgi:hypothetical protein